MWCKKPGGHVHNITFPATRHPEFSELCRLNHCLPSRHCCSPSHSISSISQPCLFAFKSCDATEHRPSVAIFAFTRSWAISVCVRVCVCVRERECVITGDFTKVLSVVLCWVVMSKFKPCETLPLPLMKGCLLRHLDNIWLNFSTHNNRAGATIEDTGVASSVFLPHESEKSETYGLRFVTKKSKWWDSQPYHGEK